MFRVDSEFCDSRLSIVRMWLQCLPLVVSRDWDTREGKMVLHKSGRAIHFCCDFFSFFFL